MRRQKLPAALLDAAAIWCSILAADRHAIAWSIKLHTKRVTASPHSCGGALVLDTDDRSLSLAWLTYVAVQRRKALMPGVAWAEAEALLRTGEYVPTRGGFA